MAPSQKENITPASIFTEASRASFASVTSLLRRSGSVANVLSRHESIRTKQEAQTAYLKTRFQILEQFDALREHPDEVDDPRYPVLSANGDIKHDFMLAQYGPCSGMRDRMRQVLGSIYGINSLELGSRPEDMYATRGTQRTATLA
jgi:hypothetical protein